MIKGIIFDLGSTLIKFTKDWDTVSQEGAEAMATWYLKKKHIRLDSAALVETFLADRVAGWKTARQTHTEILATQILLDTLKKIEAPLSTGALAQAAIKIYFQPEEDACRPYPDAVDTLKLLKGQGYRLGLYSNATDDPLVQRLINRNSLRPWLSPTFSSAGWGWRKPMPEPFELIAKRWDLPAQEIAVVGDTLQADILGAQIAGMHSVLVTMDEASSNANSRHIQPSATVDSLAQLPEVIGRL